MTGAVGERTCPECAALMVLEYDGRFSTLYICHGCGSRLTIPPRQPAVVTDPSVRAPADQDLLDQPDDDDDSAG